MTDTWQIARHALDGILEHAREAQPAECCGVLLGNGRMIVEAVRARNLSVDPNRFLIDPRDHIEARRDGRRRGCDIAGFYHSHPYSSAQPSPTDLAEASYADHLYLIVGLRAEPAELRLFQFVAGNFLERVLVTVP